MPYIYTAVINVGVGGIAVIKCRKPESGCLYIGTSVSGYFNSTIFGKQQGNSLIISIINPYLVLTVYILLCQYDTSPLFVCFHIELVYNVTTITN